MSYSTHRDVKDNVDHNFNAQVATVKLLSIL